MFVFTILGYLCFAFAFVDVLLNNVFGVDITGVIWSPIAAGLLGMLFRWIGAYADIEGDD